MLFEKVKTKSIIEKILLTYLIKSQEIIEALVVWAEALLRQCEIWLFSVEVQYKMIIEA